MKASCKERARQELIIPVTHPDGKVFRRPSAVGVEKRLFHKFY